MAKILLAEDSLEEIRNWLDALSSRGVDLGNKSIDKLVNFIYKSGDHFEYGQHEFHMAANEFAVNNNILHTSYDCCFMDLMLRDGSTALATNHVLQFAPQTRIILISSDQRKQRQYIQKYLGESRVQEWFASGRLCFGSKTMETHLNVLHELTGLPREPRSYPISGMENPAVFAEDKGLGSIIWVGRGVAVEAKNTAPKREKNREITITPSDEPVPFDPW